MAGNTYVTKNYSTYNIPAQRDGYDVVETKAIERVPASMVGYTDSIGSPSKLEPLKEYGHTPTMSGGPKYAPKNHYDDNKSNYKVTYENTSLPVNPNEYTRGYFSEESSMVHLRPGYVRSESISSPNKSWQVAGPSSAHHPLTKSTNNTNEALGIPEEYEYYSPYAHPRQQREVLDDLSTFAQPFKPQSAYENYAFVSKLESGHEHAHGWHSFVPKLQGGHGYEDGYYAFVPKRKSGHEYNTAYVPYVPEPNGAHYNITTGYTYQPRADPIRQRGLADDMDSDEAYTVHTSPPEPRRHKWTKWWKTKT